REWCGVWQCVPQQAGVDLEGREFVPGDVHDQKVVGAAVVCGKRGEVAVTCIVVAECSAGEVDQKIALRLVEDVPGRAAELCRRVRHAAVGHVLENDRGVGGPGVVAGGAYAGLCIQKKCRLGQSQALVRHRVQIKLRTRLGVEDVALREIRIRLVGVGERLRGHAGVEHGDAARYTAEGLGELGGEARRDRRIVAAGATSGEQAV